MQKLKVNAGKFLGANQQVHLQKAHQQNKEEAFQDGNFTQKADRYLSKNKLENTRRCIRLVHANALRIAPHPELSGGIMR